MYCEELQQIQIAGQEFGATTGRPRKCNWININNLSYAAKVNDITHLIVNKVDVLTKVGKYCYIQDGVVQDAGSSLRLSSVIVNSVPNNVSVVFSESPHKI